MGFRKGHTRTIKSKKSASSNVRKIRVKSTHTKSPKRRKKMMFERILLGHLVGDYLLQNQWMALSKSKNTWNGWFAAFIHCALYTLAVCLFMQNFDWLWIVVVFNSHFWIDKFALAEKYKRIIGSSMLKEFVHRMRPMINRREIVEGGFAALTYTVTDNTMHLLLMWSAYQIIY